MIKKKFLGSVFYNLTLSSSSKLVSFDYDCGGLCEWKLVDWVEQYFVCAQKLQSHISGWLGWIIFCLSIEYCSTKTNDHIFLSVSLPIDRLVFMEILYEIAVLVGKIWQFNQLFHNFR